jgi:hypothetical protein
MAVKSPQATAIDRRDLADAAIKAPESLEAAVARQ